MNFNATATYAAEIVSTTIFPDGSASVSVRNKDALGNVIGVVDMWVPSDHSANVTHQRTGDTGVAVSPNMGDAISMALAEAGSLLSAVISAGKHAL